MVPSFNFSIKSDSINGFALGCNATVEKDGYVASVALSNLLKSIEFSFGLGRKFPNGHLTSILLNGTRAQGLHRVTLDYIVNPEDLPQKLSGISKIGVAYSIGLGQERKWDIHTFTSGIEGIAPYPYKVSWNHTYVSN